MSRQTDRSFRARLKHTIFSSSVKPKKHLPVSIPSLMLAFFFVALTLAWLSVVPSTAHARPLGGGSVATCNEAAFKLALAGGGTVTFSCSGIITLTSSALITAPTTINGTGQAVTISGGGAVLVMQVNVGASLTLNNLTIANGYVYDRSGVGSGGGISNYGTLTVTNSAFAGNRADTWGGGGGGIMNIGGTLTIRNSTFYSNSAGEGYGGGGVYNQSGTLNITHSTFSGNSAYPSPGGGIYNSGKATISNSAFAGNRADTWGGGGGIYNDSTSTTTITNSTFVGNIAGGSTGGGIHNYSGTLTIANTTFSNNFASAGGGIFNEDTTTIVNSTFSFNGAATGSGISNNSGTVTLRNTIVANSFSGGNCSGTITNGGNNIDDGATCGWGSASGSMSGTNPLLGALTGSPAYLLLNAGSPAIDAGNDAICAAAPVSNTSQNGIPRPRGPHCDIGSYEDPIYKIYLPLALKNF